MCAQARSVVGGHRIRVRPAVATRLTRGITALTAVLVSLFLACAAMIDRARSQTTCPVLVAGIERLVLCGYWVILSDAWAMSEGCTSLKAWHPNAFGSEKCCNFHIYFQSVGQVLYGERSRFLVLSPAA